MNMKTIKRICIAMLSAMLLFMTIAFAEETDTGATLISDPVFENKRLTFTANEDLVLYRVWVYTERGMQVPLSGMKLISGSKTLANGDEGETVPGNQPGKMVRRTFGAGSVVECSGDDRYLSVPISHIEFWKAQKGVKKLVYDCIAQKWVGSKHNMYFEAYREDSAIALYAKREIYIYGVTVIKADGRKVKASDITNELGNMFSRNGATMLKGSTIRFPNEVGLRAGVSVVCTIKGVEEKDIAKAIILLDKKGKQTVTYDFQTESWLGGE